MADKGSTAGREQSDVQNLDLRATPFPLKFLVLIRMAGISAQNRAPVILTGKIVLTKGLDETFWGWTWVVEDRWGKKPKAHRTGHRSKLTVQRGCG